MTKRTSKTIESVDHLIANKIEIKPGLVGVVEDGAITKIFECETAVNITILGKRGGYKASATVSRTALIIALAPVLIEALEDIQETLVWAKKEGGKMPEYAVRDLTCEDSKLTLALAELNGEQNGKRTDVISSKN